MRLSLSSKFRTGSEIPAKLLRYMAFAGLCFGTQMLPAFAQSAERRPPAVSFQVYLWRESAPSVVTEVRREQGEVILTDYVAPDIRYVDSATGTSHLIGAVERRMSPLHRTHSGELTFVRETVATTEAEAVRTPIGSVSLPSGASRVVLFLFPEMNAAAEQYRIVPVQTGTQDIPPGSTLVINISGEPLAAKVGTRQMMLEPGETELVRIEPSERSALPLVVVSRDEDGQWQRRHSKNLVIDKDSSSLLLLYRDGESYRSLVLRNDLQEEPAGTGGSIAGYP